MGNIQSHCWGSTPPNCSPRWATILSRRCNAGIEEPSLRVMDTLCEAVFSSRLQGCGVRVPVAVRVAVPPVGDGVPVAVLVFVAVGVSVER